MYIVAELPGEFQISLKGCLLESLRRGNLSNHTCMEKKQFDAKPESSQRWRRGCSVMLVKFWLEVNFLAFCLQQWTAFSHQYHTTQIQALDVIFFDFHQQASYKDIHSVGTCTGPSCKNELVLNQDSSSIPSHLHHDFLQK